MAATVRKANNGKFQVRWRAPDGKESGKTFEYKRDADAFKREIDAQMTRGDYVDPSRGRMTFEELAALWMGDPSWEATTRERQASILRVHVLPKWGRYQIRHVTHEAAQAWVNDLCVSVRPGSRAPLAPRTIHKVVGVFRGVLEQAVRSRRLSSNPADDVRLPRPRSSRRRYLDVAEVERLARAHTGGHDAIQLLAYTGLRFSELAGLKVKYLDLARSRPRLMVEEVVVELDSGTMHWKDPKDYERRPIVLAKFLVPILQARIEGLGPEDLVFPSAAGTPMRKGNFRRDAFNPAVKEAGLDGLTPHGLRHTAASLAISGGANVLAVQRMLGHEKPSTTLDIYSDLFDSDLEDVATSMNTKRSEALVDEMWMSESPSAA
ncbi:tyrosine-type recombinase/integrase [Demequina sp. SO4-13]|uniref:tyrosine-type recombinase/integrase n=1 Tax=Demequina sp. SO4-13 TaxID=3401027 RepID=UPI003AF82A89